eukprot:TRINITY_DN4179_c0_g1_i2.p1 TRINITY_DN4179_c0_g1~~TRINITY_DN4179_c0_g1_i2.p1  ORF type:complete len:581 (+),score=96.76 TRINITY_DN4179_c0_g1_i2:3-1745(+)
MKTFLLLLVSIAYVASQEFPSSLKGPDLIFYLSFDNSSIPTVDESQYSTNISCTRCPTPSQGLVGNGMRFQLRQFLEVAPTPILVPQQLTISTLYKVAKHIDYAKIFCKPFFPPPRWENPFVSYALSAAFEREFGRSPQIAIGSTEAVGFDGKANATMDVSRWYHIVGTFDLKTLKLYIDGGLVANQSVPIGTTLGHPDIVSSFIGCRGSDAQECLDGDLDELAIWNRALNETEIVNLYKSLSSIPPSKSPETSNIGPIIAAIVVVIIVVTIVILIAVFVVLRKRKKKLTPSPIRPPVSPSINTGNYGTLLLVNTVIEPQYVIKMSEISIVGDLGKGASGVVYKGIWRGKEVAVKQLISLSDHEKGLFLREYSLMRSLKPHPNVLSFFGIVQDPISIVTEFCPMGALSDLLGSPANIDMVVAVKILRDVAHGMAHLQTQNIVHRDLAARNCLLMKLDHAKVADFGMSRAATSDGKISTKSDIGPIKWMAPETFEANEFSHQSDVYSFGVLCIEVLTREKPYPDIPLEDFVLHVISKDLTKLLPSYIPESTSSSLKQMITTCLSKDSSARPTFARIVELLQ